MKAYSVKLTGFFFLLSFCCLLLFSPDSIIYDPLLHHWDVSWFYTCGRAWMNGLIPYVDFADSKGPLLWLIYGIGYLISPHDYLGVFVLSIFLYTGIFYFSYKTSFIFLQDKRKSMIVVFFLIASFFCTFYHNEIHAEDWCQLFITASSYRICYFLYTEEGKKNKATYWTCFVLGLSLSGTMLIKYSLTVMLGFSSMYLLYALIKERKNIIISFLSLLCGVFLILAPITLYMIIEGNFSEFSKEYFFITIQTIDTHNNLATYVHEWLRLTYDTHFVLIFVVCLLGAIKMAYLTPRYSGFFVFSFIGFFAIAIHHCGTLVFYYLSACSFFPIWLCIVFVEKTKSHTVLKCTLIAVLVFTVTSNLFINFGHLRDNLFLKDTEARQDRYRMAYYMSQLSHPTILYYRTADYGIGVLSEALPCIRYWAYQSGATKEMAKMQNRSVEKKAADFIFTDDNDGLLEIKDRFILARGYKEIYHGKYSKYKYKFYTKHLLKSPPTSFHVNNIDILLRKDVFNE